MKKNKTEVWSIFLFMLLGTMALLINGFIVQFTVMWFISMILFSGMQWYCIGLLEGSTQ